MQATKLPSQSRRGKVCCLSCGKDYASRYKPKFCIACGYDMGGSYEPSAKNRKTTLPRSRCVVVCRQEGETNMEVEGAGEPLFQLFSVQTTNRDNRCFVVVGHAGESKEQQRICYSSKCKEARSMFVASGKVLQFTCEHLDSIPTADECIYSIKFTDEEVRAFTPDLGLQQMMIENQSGNMPTVVKLTETSYAVNGEPDTNNPFGFCHVKDLECTSDSCKRKYGRTKQVQRRKLCLHLHYVMLARRLKGEKIDLQSDSASADSSAFSSLEHPTTSKPDQSNELVVTTAVDSGRRSTDKKLWHLDLEGLSETRAAALKVQMKRLIPYQIPLEILQRLGSSDAASHLRERKEDCAWPNSFSPSESMCCLCHNPLGPPVIPQGRDADGHSYLLTNLNPFRRVEILVRKCQNKRCKAVHHLFPYQLGLFNVCNKVLVGLDILLEWREAFKEGFPLTNIITVKIKGLLHKIKESDRPPAAEIDYLIKLLYSGFYGFEAMTIRDINSSICGICGIIGEVYLGDGNEKNCCSLQEVSGVGKDEKTNCSTRWSEALRNSSLEDFLDRIRLQMIDKSTHAKGELRFSVNMNEIPPVIAPSLRKAEINTERFKNSIYLKRGSTTQGDPALLSKYIKENSVSIADLEKMDRNKLLKISEFCKVSTSQKSNDLLRHDLQQLYATLIVGTSPCHGFTKSQGHTGGFYHFVCRHGCTVASKFLILTESVRDAADLYLSLKYPPITFVCDTACTLVRHLNIRAPEMTNQLWGKYDGCFEVPDIHKEPNGGINVPFIIPSEYKATAETMKHMPQNDTEHPLTGESRRFIVGDRFHSSTNPHKSHLCKFHNINLCQQSHALKTSYQESENNRKNNKRLRSSCMQNFHTHFYYNYLMDLYQNETIVLSQKRRLEEKTKKSVVRDNYFRFVIQ